jgi:nitrogen fixation NifU-like protein
MDFFNVPATARISFAFYNMTEEIDILLSVLRKLVNKQSAFSTKVKSSTTTANDNFQKVVNQYSDHALNFGECTTCNHTEEGFNPFCGDHLLLHVLLNGDRIEEVKFEGELCLISKSSASMMSCALKGKTICEAQKMFREFVKMMDSSDTEITELQNSGDLAVFSVIRNSPSRVKCALLPWKTMEKVLSKEELVM